MGYLINDDIPSFMDKKSIITILDIVDWLKPKTIIELMPGCGPLVWHILSNFPDIINYHAVDTWHGCGVKKLKKHGINGYISLELFLSYNKFENLTYEQNNFVDFAPNKDYDLWIIDHDQSEDFYLNKENIIIQNFLNIFSKIKKGNKIIIYDYIYKPEYNKAIHVLKSILDIKTKFIDDNVILLEKL